jgi:large subunit ribosomal protein L15
MLQLNDLQSLVKNRKRRGRGGSRGGTSGRGHKGQLARSGGRSANTAAFEGGQMPLTRRLPRRGFVNPFRVEFQLISLSALDAAFNSGDVVDTQALRDKGLLKGKRNPAVKVLANGAITKALTIKVDRCTASARALIEQAGGSVSGMEEMNSDSSAA